jgi:hypothetical protein
MLHVLHQPVLIRAILSTKEMIIHAVVMNNFEMGRVGAPFARYLSDRANVCISVEELQLSLKEMV